MKFLLYLSILPAFLVALTVHEAAHALSSKWLGDRYAQKKGRISLNPMRHLSALGTLVLFIIGFGWGKPVPVNLYNYKHPKFYYLLSSLAGPFSNILMAAASLALLYGMNWLIGNTTLLDQQILGWPAYRIFMLFWWFLHTSLYINIILAAFNMIPIPPLDGSKIWPCLIPGLRPAYSGKTTIIWAVILIIAMQGNLMSKVTGGAIDLVNNLVPEMTPPRVTLPPNFPVEIKAPSTANGATYEKTVDAHGEPNSFTATFWQEQPYPALKYRTVLAENMSNYGWSMSINDSNKWEMSNIIDDGEGRYKTLTWSGIWEKENNKFYANIKYYADPNGQNPTDFMDVEYKYVKMNP